ncbi:nucleoside deaminase [Arthrobacter deserti]|uniref:Nucleoside deaminase n=1 Tax=Arthrobacter deserti TaxID=1742687 RepID=A0ABX1JVF8_9MICC|nr:nucleoside deaminase [Arthrobacter deserti]
MTAGTDSFGREHFEAAVEAARRGLAGGGVPVGAALERHGRLLAAAHNGRVQAGDPTAHGEIACLRAAGRQADYTDTVLHTTLAPCAMCTGAILQFRIPTVVVGEAETFGGELDLLRGRGVRVVLLNDRRCVDLMREFQRTRPALWAEDIGA